MRSVHQYFNKLRKVGLEKELLSERDSFQRMRLFAEVLVKKVIDDKQKELSYNPIINHFNLPEYSFAIMLLLEAGIKIVEEK